MIMRVIGLTGGIASGKSTVSKLLEAHGLPVLDADSIYHELLQPQNGAPSPLGVSIGAHFDNVLEGDGSINRKKLGEMVFGHPERLKKLSALTHPAVGLSFGQRIAELREAGAPCAIYDVPLLFENGLESGLDGVIVVWVPHELQLSRLCERDGISEERAMARLGSQGNLDSKRDKATWVIDNSGTRDETREKVDALVETLTA